MRALVSSVGRHVPEVVHRPLPRAGTGQIAVDVIASAINPVDQFIAAGTPPETAAWQDIRGGFGITGTVGLGWDVAGTVAAVGPQVEGIAVGELVAGLEQNLGAPTRAHAERVVLDAAAVAAIPNGMDPIAAGTIPLNALTAAAAVRMLGTGSGRTLLITGAAGAVGGYAAALAAGAGWTVDGLARSADTEFVAGTGATPVTELGDRRWDVVFDAAVLRERALSATRDGGHYLGVQPASPLPVERGVTTESVSVRADGSLLAELLERSRTGELAVRIAGTVPLDEAPAAYATVAGGGQRGRWVVVP